MAEAPVPDGLPAEAAEAAEAAEHLCDARALEESGRAVVWNVMQFGQPVGAFALRFEGRVVAYLNRCAHVPAEMDWKPGEFFDADRRWLLCSIHGAAYEPADGRCVGGPCGRGRPAGHRRRRTRWRGLLVSFPRHPAGAP